MRARLAMPVCVLALAAGGLTGCGDDDQAADLASLAPPDAPLYAEATIRPDGDQAEAIEPFVERVGGISDPGALLVSQLDAALAGEGLDATYADDVEPWLGERGGFFVSSFEPTIPNATTPDLALMLEVDDADAARDFLSDVVEHDPATEEERSYEGVDYFSTEDGFAAGVVDDSALVVGTEAAFQVAVDSSQGESLGESAEYADLTDPLPDDALGSIVFEPDETVEAILASEGADPAQVRMWKPVLDGLLSDSVGAALTLTSDSASIDLSAMLSSDVLLSADSALLTALPGDAWLAIAVPKLGQALEHGLDQLTSSGLRGARDLERQVRERTGLDPADVFGWLGDAAAFIAGTDQAAFRAGLIAETSDTAASEDLVAALQRIPEVEAGVVGDEVVAARGASVDEVLHPDQTLGDAPGFTAATEALGDDFPPGFYLDLPAFFRVAEQGSDGDIDYDAIRPYTDAFASLIAGSRVDGDLVLSRFTVSLAGD